MPEPDFKEINTGAANGWFGGIFELLGAGSSEPGSPGGHIQAGISDMPGQMPGQVGPSNLAQSIIGGAAMNLPGYGTAFSYTPGEGFELSKGAKFVGVAVLALIAWKVLE